MRQRWRWPAAAVKGAPGLVREKRLETILRRPRELGGDLLIGT